MIIDKLKSGAYFIDNELDKLIDNNFGFSLYVKMCNKYDLSRISNNSFELDNVELNEIEYTFE